MEITLEHVRDSIRNVPDFPKPGIQFKDVSTSFNKPEILKFIIKEIASKYKEAGITKVVGVESRGFIIGSMLAHELNAGFVPARKPGKLPYEKYTTTYDLEYGTDSIEMHVDAIEPHDIVLIHDDLLATGGTVNAAVELVRKFNVNSIYVNFFVELDFLEGRSKIDSTLPVWSLIHF